VINIFSDHLGHPLARLHSESLQREEEEHEKDELGSPKTGRYKVDSNFHFLWEKRQMASIKG
jgi:hypothetical protein